MVALFGTIGNSNTSCRQMATQEQMDRYKGDGYTMNLFCEEVHKLEAEFKQCRKLLNAIGDENRQHLICVMMNMPIDGGLVLEIVEQTHHPGCHSLI